VRRAEVFKKVARVAGELEERRAQFVRDDFDMMPGKAVAPACAQSLEGRLLGGEARGVVLRRDRLAAPFAIGALLLCENALAEARRACEHFTHAPDFDNVYPDGDDHN